MQVYDHASEAPRAYVELLDAARTAMKKAYAPYSQFPVGAAALLSNGQIISGSNQENASFPLGLCAERVALFAAGAAFPDQAIRAIAVIAAKIDEQWISPCGACRQVMLESEQRGGQNMDIILTNRSGQIAVIPSAATLLPWCFDGHLLNR